MTPELLYLYGNTAMHSAIQSEARKTTAIPMAPVVIDNRDRKMQPRHKSDDQEKHEDDGQETDLLPLPSPRIREKREEGAELWDGSEDEVHGSDEGEDVEVRIRTLLISPTLFFLKLWNVCSL